MRVLAFDISTAPGIAVLEVKQLKGGPKVRLLHVTSVRTDSSYTDAQRYEYIAATATKVIYEYGPFDVVCREHFAGGRNKRATQTVFGAWASIDSALATFGYTIKTDAELTPSAVKKAATGKGSASKAEVEAGVREKLGLADDFTFKSDDESDAVAVGIAYLIKKGVIAE